MSYNTIENSFLDKLTQTQLLQMVGGFYGVVGGSMK